MSTQTLEQLSGLERHLQRSLRPVEPNPDFVNRLHTNLSTPASMVVASRSRPELGFILALGLAVGFLVWWLIRQFR